MALSAAQVWEVRTTGNDANGGAFKAGSSGTDFSQQDTPQIAVTDAVATGGATITSASAAFALSHIGNVVYMTGGTSALAPARYEVIGVVDASTITLDRSVPTGTGITLNLGGAIASLGELANATRGMVTSNAAFVKAGSGYTLTATPTFSVGADATPSVPYSRLIGYATTRGDNGQVSLTLSTNTGLSAISITGSSWLVANFNINCASLGTSTGINSSGNYAQILNCKVANATSYGIVSGATNFVVSCEVTGCGSSAVAVSVGGNSRLYDCFIHDNSCRGMNLATGGEVAFCVIANNLGSTAYGIANTYGTTIVNNTIYGNGSHGINTTAGKSVGCLIRGNILAKNGASGTGYGLYMGGSAGTPAMVVWDGNAYWSNTSGNRFNADDTTTNPQNGAGAYSNVFDVVLSADPFTARASNDFTLNNAGGGGAACRLAGVPRSWPGLAIAGYADMGAVQHQDPGGGVNVFFLEG